MQLRALLENYRPAPDELGIPRFVSRDKNLSRQYVTNVVCFLMPKIEGLVFANLENVDIYTVCFVLNLVSRKNLLQKHCLLECFADAQLVEKQKLTFASGKLVLAKNQIGKKKTLWSKYRALANGSFTEPIKSLQTLYEV